MLTVPIMKDEQRLPRPPACDSLMSFLLCEMIESVYSLCGN